ncbi:FYVE and coiled-coil domain-containing protein 1 [Protopterus annectens]|uniref:FYVE and coiled-coil domain-containing protein 1 n=1 Tax=Protopterus annectens TaxID=7888 RepID=UPI001CFAF99A|nr:FYVE and coiled-coil domain-containing protein 1 [Protopterus annectens]
MASSVGESQLQRIIRDLQDAVTELSKEYRENGEPVTDDSTSLHKLCFKLEYLLQFDKKERSTFLGNRKDYWDYFCDCLAKVKGANDGIRFVKSIPELKTSLGKGRAFIRYSLVHQRLADTLQQCLMNKSITSEWYSARSPFLSVHMSSELVNSLYELNDVQFDIASRGHDLDAAWPTFARRTLASTNSPAHLWRPPSRSSSISSLVNTYLQAHDFTSSPDANSSLLTEQLETVDELRIELDQSELKQRDMQERIQQLEKENERLQKATELLQTEVEKGDSENVSEENFKTTMQEIPQMCGNVLYNQNTIQDLQECLKTLELTAARKQQEYHTMIEELKENNKDSALKLQTLAHELEALKAAEKLKDVRIEELQEKLHSAEQRNVELSEKMNVVLNEKGQQTADHYESAVKIHELLDKLNQAEKEKIEMQKNIIELESQVKTVNNELEHKRITVAELESECNALALRSGEENQKFSKKIEDLECLMNKLTGSLSVKEKEAANLQMQLQDSVRYAEMLEKEWEEKVEYERREKDELQKQYDNREETLQEQITSLSEKIKYQENDMLMVAKSICLLEEQNSTLISEKESMIKMNKELEEDVRIQGLTLEKDSEELSLQITPREHKSLEDELSKLQTENAELKQRGINVNSELVLLQTEYQNTKQEILQLKKDLLLQKEHEESLSVKIAEQQNIVLDKENLCKQHLQDLQNDEDQVKFSEKEQLSLEKKCLQQAEAKDTPIVEKASVERIELEQKAFQEKDVAELNTRLEFMEQQLNTHVNELSRLQDELLKLRSKLQQALDEKEKMCATLEVTEKSLEEHKALLQQLEEQVESLNRDHVQGILQSKEREKEIQKEKQEGDLKFAEMENGLLALQEELSSVKQNLDKSELENVELKDLLHRANIQTAELGIQICSLSSEKDDAEQKVANVSHQLEQLKEQITAEREKFTQDASNMRVEKESLQQATKQYDELIAANQDLKKKLGKAEKYVKSIQETSKEELSAVKFQMSTDVMNYQTQLKNTNEELGNVKSQLQAQNGQVAALQQQVAELQTGNAALRKQLDDKNEQVASCHLTIHKKDEEVTQLTENLERIQEELVKARNLVKEVHTKLDKETADKDREKMKLLADLDDLNRTKSTLEERLIELIRDKDALWQKSDALEFEQKMRAEERWLGDREVNRCLDCKSTFTWFLRRHHCRLCGRIFCYYCSSHFVMTKHSGKKERCCRTCLHEHSAVVQRLSESESSSTNSPDHSPSLETQRSLQDSRVTVTEEVHRPPLLSEVAKPDDATFDIITDEEVCEVKDSDSSSHSRDEPQDNQDELQDLLGTEQTTASSLVYENTEEIPVLQDAEICLLKSGEVSTRLSMSIEEISEFGDSRKELFIKSNSYSVISLMVIETGLTINWVFSSEPKSVSFCVVYQESAESPLEQSVVLIPLTRCNSHKETIQGQLKARKSGIYLLIFDNSFSRFVSKMVSYHLAVERPVVYDGSDFL